MFIFFFLFFIYQKIKKNFFSFIRVSIDKKIYALDFAITLKCKKLVFENNNQYMISGIVPDHYQQAKAYQLKFYELHLVIHNVGY